MRQVLFTTMQWLLIVATVGSAYRVVRGPRAADRLAGLNVISGLILAFLVLRGVWYDRALYLDVALVYGILGFLGMLAIGRILKDKIREGE